MDDIHHVLTPMLVRNTYRECVHMYGNAMENCSQHSDPRVQISERDY